MNDFLLSYLGIVAGILTLLGIIGVVEWASRIRAHLHCKTTVKVTPPPECNLKNVGFKTSPTPEQIEEALEEIEDASLYPKDYKYNKGTDYDTM